MADLGYANRLVLPDGCNIMLVPPVEWNVSTAGGPFSNYDFGEAAFILIGCDDVADTIISPLTKLLLESSYPIPFYASLVPAMSALSVCMLLSWFLVTFSLIVARGPLIQQVLLLFVCINYTKLFSDLHAYVKEQHVLGYESLLQWQEKYYASRQIIGMFVCVGLIWIAEYDTIIGLYKRPLQRRIIRCVYAVLAVTDLALWICLSVRGSVYDSMMWGYCPYTRPWIAVEITSYVLCSATTLAWFISMFRFSFARNNWGIAALTIAGYTLSIPMLIVTMVLPQTLTFAVPVWVLFRTFACKAAWHWKNSIDVLDRERLQKGDMGRQLYESNIGRAYDRHFSGRGDGYGTTTVVKENPFLRFVDWLFHPSSALMAVRGLRTVSPGHDIELAMIDSPIIADTSGSRTRRTQAVHSHPPAHWKLENRAEEPENEFEIESHDIETVSRPCTTFEVDLESLSESSFQIGGATAPPGSSGDTSELPPQFEPLPGFQRGDYWDEKKSRHVQ